MVSKFIRDKKAISGIVATVLMIALVLLAVGVVWGFVSNVLEGQTEQASSCFEIIGKIELRDQYTCYDSSENELKFSISVGDVEIDDIRVTTTSEEGSESFLLSDVGEEISKNSGKTFRKEMEKPDSIFIVPLIEGNSCEKADTINSIPDCAVFE